MKTQTKLSLATALILSTTAQAQTVDIGTITVTSATKATQSLQDITTDIDVITAEELQEKHITTVIDALSLIADISISQSGGVGQQSSFFLRGASSGQTLVLIDGIRYNDPTTIESSAMLEYLEINDIKQIEIIKGASSGIWGADASAGVINIITKSPKQGVSSGFAFEYGSFNTKKTKVNISYKNDKYYIKTNGMIFTTDGWTAKALRGEDIDKYEDDKYENTTLDIATGYKLNDANKIDISHKIIDTQTDYDNFNGNDSKYRLDSKTNLSSIRFNHIDKFNIIDIYGKKSTFDREDPLGWTKEFKGKVDEYGISSKIPYNKKDFFIIGVDNKNFEDTKNDREYTNKALFLSNANTIDNLKITQSLRYDKFDKFENKATGKIGIKYNIKENFYTSLNYGTSYKAPSLYNLYDSYSGNENLIPQTTKSIDFKIGYDAFEAVYFKSTIDDEIQYNNATWKYYNSDKQSIIKGYELKYSDEVVDDLLIRFDWTKLKAEDSDGYQLAKRPKDTVKLGIDYYGIDRFHIGLDTQYIGERVEYVYGTHTVSAQTGKYTVANGVINYQISKNLKTYLKIQNITDKYYQTTNGYATSPRAYYVGIDVKF